MGCPSAMTSAHPVEGFEASVSCVCQRRPSGETRASRSLLLAVNLRDETCTCWICTWHVNLSVRSYCARVVILWGAQVSRVVNSASGYDWIVTFLTDVEPSATSSRMVVSYNGLVGSLGGDITLEVTKSAEVCCTRSKQRSTMAHQVEFARITHQYCPTPESRVRAVALS